MGSLHGGVVSSLLELCNKIAVKIFDKFQRKNRIVKSETQYIKGAAEGTFIWLKCEIEKIGKELAFVKTSVLDEKGTTFY